MKLQGRSAPNAKLYTPTEAEHYGVKFEAIEHSHRITEDTVYVDTIDPLSTLAYFPLPSSAGEEYDETSAQTLSLSGNSPEGFKCVCVCVCVCVCQLPRPHGFSFSILPESARH